MSGRHTGSHALWLLFLISALIGAIALAGCGYVSSGASAKTVDVTLTDFKVTSTQTSFIVGQRYTFSIRNAGATEHEFLILPPMMDGMGSMDQMHMVALAVVEHIAPGQTKTADVTFTKPTAPGDLEMACHVGSHYDLGMKTPITVTQG